MRLPRPVVASFAILFAVALVCVAPSARAIEVSAEQAILLDMTTGTVLFEKNADERMTPSSMSKMITIYALFERLKDGRLSLDDTFRVSERAWRKQGSKMFVAVNSRVRVEELIRGIIVQSGNDACIVVAEGLAGSEDAFAEQLNEIARRLGMTNSQFTNASGWPDPKHYSTARDLAKLAAATVRDFPEYYHYYAETEFTYNGIKQRNRNPLLNRGVGADGLKTGHTEDGGYGLAASAERNGRRLVAVLNGMDGEKSRASESERMIDWGFREFNNYALFDAGATVAEAPVWLGEDGHVPLVIQEGLTLTLPIKSRKEMVVKVAYESPVEAPITAGTQLATLRVEVPDMPTAEVPLVAGQSVEKLGMISRLGAALRYIVWGESG